MFLGHLLKFYWNQLISPVVVVVAVAVAVIVVVVFLMFSIYLYCLSFKWNTYLSWSSWVPQIWSPRKCRVIEWTKIVWGGGPTLIRVIVLLKFPSELSPHLLVEIHQLSSQLRATLQPCVLESSDPAPENPFKDIKEASETAMAYRSPLFHLTIWYNLIISDSSDYLETECIYPEPMMLCCWSCFELVSRLLQPWKLTSNVNPGCLCQIVISSYFIRY